MTDNNTKIDCMPIDELKQLQLSLINQQLARANKTVAYQGKLPPNITSLSDLQKLPFTTKDDLRQNYPYGFLAVPQGKIARFNATSGTTGIPTLAYFTQTDIDYLTERGVRHLMMAGITPKNRVQSMIGNGLFVGGWYHNNAAFKLGVTVLPTQTGNTKKQIDFLKQLKADFLFATSGYLQYLFNQMSSEDIQQIHLKKALVGAEPLSKSFARNALTNYGVEVYESYGMTETGGPLSHECHLHNGLHVAEDHIYIEIINPENGEVLPEGEYGELVITPLQQEAMPLIRYRTRDITRIIPEKCPCGRTHRRIESITHRIDDMMIINGANVFPSQIEECIYKHISTATNYLIHVIEKNGLKKLLIDIELPIELLTNPEALKTLESELIKTIRSYITVSPKLNFVEIGTLPEVQGKAKRVVIEG